MSIGPAYKSFVAGECSPEIANERLHGDFYNILYSYMYGNIDQNGSFYHPGYEKFLHSVRSYIKTRNPHHFLSVEDEGVLKYFYNRQLIVQMTMHPQNNGNDSKNQFHVSVPLYREPDYEVQTDILQLLPEQSKANYNMRYFVVIVDTYSRFIWCCPVANLQSIKVQKAFISALMRPGISENNYNNIRQSVQRVVVDGGSEFKSVFPEAIKLYFPNAKVITSSPKNRTGNRPTGNGPIEAAIRLLRLVMRDYALGISPTFLSTQNNQQHYGLSKILESYNNAPQIALHDKSPIRVMNDGVDSPIEVLKTWNYLETKRKRAIVLKQKNQTLVGGNQISKDRHGPYRLPHL